MTKMLDCAGIGYGRPSVGEFTSVPDKGRIVGIRKGPLVPWRNILPRHRTILRDGLFYHHIGKTDGSVRWIRGYNPNPDPYNRRPC